ncbi:MAG TPA: hypothetical protein VKT80_12105 [Chloroflexota bacterium]|nr:hypothetical protein [Chloroflexota bacterium]
MTKALLSCVAVEGPALGVADDPHATAKIRGAIAMNEDAATKRSERFVFMAAVTAASRKVDDVFM